MAHLFFFILMQPTTAAVHDWHHDSVIIICNDYNLCCGLIAMAQPCSEILLTSAADLFEIWSNRNPHNKIQLVCEGVFS